MGRAAGGSAAKSAGAGAGRAVRPAAYRRGAAVRAAQSGRPAGLACAVPVLRAAAGVHRRGPGAAPRRRGGAAGAVRRDGVRCGAERHAAGYLRPGAGAGYAGPLHGVAAGGLYPGGGADGAAADDGLFRGRGVPAVRPVPAAVLAGAVALRALRPGAGADRQRRQSGGGEAGHPPAADLHAAVRGGEVPVSARVPGFPAVGAGAGVHRRPAAQPLQPRRAVLRAAPGLRPGAGLL